MANPSPETTRLVLVRHAVTAWNSEQRFQGHADTPLSDEGRLTIPAVIAALRPWAPAAVYTSDLSRAREMAEAAAVELELPLIATPELRECGYGAWEGLTLDEVRERDPEGLDEWRRRETIYARGGGESLADMHERSWSYLERVAADQAGRAAAFFTHSGPIRGVICRLFDLGLDQRYRFAVDNSSLTVLQHTPGRGWQLLLLNQICHSV